MLQWGEKSKSSVVRSMLSRYGHRGAEDVLVGMVVLIMISLMGSFINVYASVAVPLRLNLTHIQNIYYKNLTKGKI